MGAITTSNVAASGTYAIDVEGTDDWLAITASPGSPPRSLNPVPASKRLGGGDLLLNFDWVMRGGSPTAFTQALGFTRTSAAADNLQGSAFSSNVGSGFWNASIVNYGFRLRARADSGTRTMYIYLTHWSSTIVVTARLLDGSAADATVTNISGASTTANRKIGITYTADSVTEIVVEVLLTTGTNNPNLLFSAATLLTTTPAAVDPDGPLVLVVSPPIGSEIDPTTPIVVDVSDLNNDVTTIDQVRIRLAGAAYLAIYGGATWHADYNAASSVTNNGDGTFTISIVKDAGWADHIEAIEVTATDDVSNQSTREVGSWFIETEGPTVAVDSPSIGDEVAPSDPIVLDVSDAEHDVDAIDQVRIRLVGGAYLAIYDGASWHADYNAASSVTDNGDGTFTISVKKDTGWAGAVAAIEVTATDEVGNQAVREVGSWFFDDSAVAPTIAIVSPTPGVPAGDPGGFPDDFAAAITTPIVLDIDAPDGIALAVVVVRFRHEPTVERVVFRRGSFRRGFAVASWSEVIGDALRLHVIPDGAWPATSADVLNDVAFDVDAVGGNGTSLSAIGASS